MTLEEIRKLVIIALFSDDELMEMLVVKGGNALDLIYNVSARTSVDVDVSMSGDFPDFEDAKKRIFRALRERFDAAGYVVFDEKFDRRPSVVGPKRNPRWGGYQVIFKIIPRALHAQHQHDLDSLRRNASVIGPGHLRNFTIDISKFEYCEPKEEHELDSFTVYAYTLPMIALEKLRAICQQMDEYQQRSNPRARARDFYDIYTAVTSGNLDLTTAENLELLRNIFEAKEVPLELLLKIETTHSYHIVDWPAVELAVSEPLQSFDFYFDFVVGLVNQLKAARVI